MRASLAKLPLHPLHPVPGRCSLLPLPKHRGVLGIFRPQLTGCEIAPFAPPQPGGGWRGRNGVGGAHSQFIRLLRGQAESEGCLPWSERILPQCLGRGRRQVGGKLHPTPGT